MTNTTAALIVAAVALATYAITSRYEIAIINNASRAYVLDRWTGSVDYIELDERLKVKSATK